MAEPSVAAMPAAASVLERLYVVVMAGGSGTRFWPASRRERPKQLLELIADGPLLANTLDRLEGLVPLSRVFVVTAERLLEQTRAAVPALPPAHVIGEPIARNTAPCLGVAAAIAGAHRPDAIVALLPADHHVADPEAFRRALAAAAVASDGGRITTLGVVPTYPETGYGYIETRGAEATVGGAAHVDASAAEAPRDVVRFVEKPSLATAAEFLSGGRHLWNAGVFVGRADALLAAIATHLPALDEAARPLLALLSTLGPAALHAPALPAALSELFARAPAISIDHGIMEHLKDLRVVPLVAGWSDVGSWRSLLDFGRDDAGFVRGDVLAEDCKGCVLVSDGPTLAALGLRDVAVVAHADAVLVLPLDRSQDVRRLVDRLAAAGRGELL